MGIDQTPDGFLWVATKTGLVRFDGVQFQPFPVTAPGTAAGYVKAMLADRRGRLWVAKDLGVVVCVDQGRVTTVVGTEYALPDAGERLVVSDAEGAVWVTYISGPVLRIRDGQVRVFSAADGLPEGSACQLATDGAGQLWFAQGDWVGVFREDRFRPLGQEGFQRIAGARAGGIWGYRDRQIWKVAEGGSPVKLGTLPADVPEVAPTVMREDRAGCLWLGTTKAGLFRFDQEGGVTAPLPQQTILSLHEDREGNLWVGTRGGGLNQLKPRVVELLTTGPGIPFEPVQSLCQDTEGILWAIIWPNGRLVRGAGQAWSPLSPKEAWSATGSECLAADPRGGVWIGTGTAGLQHWQAGAVTESLDQSNGLAGNEVGALLVPPSGEVWIGPRGVEVVQCRKAGQLRTFPLPSGSGSVMALATDSAGDCWVATYGRRLLRVHGEVMTDETGGTLAEPSEIRALLGTPDGSLWIGYGGQGLGRLKAGRFSQWRTDQGLHDDYICNILSDGRGRLWFAGNRGIFSVREKDLDDFAEGRATRVRPVVYGRNDGLLRLQANYNFWPGAQRGTDGRLLFAMQSGVAVVYADDLKQDPEPPPVLIERVTANGQTVAAYEAGGLPKVPPASAPLELGQDGAHLRLSPDQRRLEFVFTALTFTKPESIGFRYRLRGLDADWVEAGTRRVATYAQLPPGQYRFEVTACNSDGVWNKTAAALELTAEPQWWETAWFRVGGPVAAAGLLVGGIILGLRRRHRRQVERLNLLQATEQERVRIARDLHDDLGAGLTQISLNTALVQNPAVTPEVAGGLLQEIDQRSRELVTALDEIVWAVNPKNDTVPSLARYLCQFAQQSLLPGGIVCRLEVALDLPDAPVGAEQRHNLFLAFKEALNNTLRHSGASEVRLEIVRDGRTLSVTLADNGRGFALGPVVADSDGLVNMRARLAALGGSCVVTSEPGRGTTVVLRLPLAGIFHKRTSERTVQ
jgi:signal transduction histidine kinase/ligand-binding sensor domain-containing protein